MTQPAFAAKIDVSLQTVQAIETGRRSLSDAVLRRIRNAFWAVWDSEKKRWLLEYSKPPREFTRELSEQYRSFIIENAPIPESDPEVVKMRIDALFEKVPADSWMKVYWRLQEVLEGCLTDLSVADQEKLKELFERTKDDIHVSGIVGRPVWLQRSYRWPMPEQELKQYYKQCAEHYRRLARSTSNPVTHSDQMEFIGTMVGGNSGAS